MPRPTRSAASVLFALVLACAPRAEAPPPVDAAAVEAELAALWSALSAAEVAEDSAALLALYTEDVRLDARGFPPIEGRAALAAVAGPIFAAMDYTALNITPLSTTVVNPNLAFQAGTYDETIVERATGRQRAESGRWAAALRKEADGRWRVGYLMVFSDTPAGM